MDKNARVTYLVLDLFRRADEAGIRREVIVDAWEKVIEAQRRRAAGEDVYVETEDGTLLEDVEDICVWVDDRRDARLRAVHIRDRGWRARQRERAQKLTTPERRAGHQRKAEKLRATVQGLRAQHPEWSIRAIARRLLPLSDKQDEKRIRAMAAQITRILKQRHAQPS